MIAVAGPKGGVGRTTVAVNVALAAHLHHAARRTVLVDGSLSLGDLGVHLDVDAAPGLGTLVPLTGRLEAAAVENALVRHPSGLHVLLRADTGDQGGWVTASLVRESLDILAALADLVVVDLPSTYADDRVLTVLDAATTVLLVVTPEIGAIRNAREFLRRASDLGVERSCVRVVLNRMHPGSRLSRLGIAAVLDVARIDELPEIGSAAAEHINRGRPVVEADPRSALARALRGLATSLVDVGMLVA